MDSITWNHLIASFPEPHLLQSWQWGQVKSQFGWEPTYRIWGNEETPDAAALILERRVSFLGGSTPLGVMYAPKGPLLRDWDNRDLRTHVLDDLQALARRRGAIFLKVDPDIPLGWGIPGEKSSEENPLGEKVRSKFVERGWHFSQEQIQYRNTVLVDLTPSEDEILARMKQKTRYNVRYAGRKGVTVRKGDEEDFPLLYRMYARTAERGGFAIRGKEYYHTVWQKIFRCRHAGTIGRGGGGTTRGWIDAFPFWRAFLVFARHVPSGTS